VKILIITMEDPIYTLDFIKEIIKVRHRDIIGITIAKGNRLKIGSKRSRMAYLFGLVLIMGIPSFTRYVSQTLWYNLRKRVTILGSPTLERFAQQYGVQVDFTDNPNDQEYLDRLRAKAPHVIINQSQFIITKDLLELPPLGILNRHNALLPKNRGRLTPFWVLYNQEPETGVSIHFIDEGIDSGPIVIQKRFPVAPGESFNSLVRKNYYWAPKAMLEGLDKLEKGDTHYIENSESKATYNTIPTLAQAWDFRKQSFWHLFTSG